MFKKVTLSKSFAVAATLALCVASAQAVEIPKDIQDSGKLVLGTSASVGLPWSSTKEGTTDQFIGFDHDLALAIAAKLGLKLEVANMGFDSLIPSLCLDWGHREQVCEDIANSSALFARGGSGCHSRTEAR